MADRKIRFMMDYVTATVISHIVEEENLSEDEAMKAFYNSKVFDRLCDPETGLYRKSGGSYYETSPSTSQKSPVKTAPQPATR